MTPSICFASRPPGPLEPSYHITSSLGGIPWLSPKVAHFLRSAGTWPEIFIWCWKPPYVRHHHFFYTCGSPYGRAQVHLTPAMTIQPLAKARGQVLLQQLLLVALTVPLRTRASPCPVPWFVLPPAVQTRCPRRPGMLGSLKPEHTICSLPGTALHFLGSFFFTVPQSLTLQQKGKEKNKTHSFTAATRIRHFVLSFGTLTQGDGRRKAEQ